MSEEGSRETPLEVVIGFPLASRMGGAEGMLLSLLRGRERAGIEPHVVLFEDGPFREEVEAAGVRATLIETGRFREPWRLAAAIARLARVLRSERPDLCVSWLPRVQTVLAPAAVLAGMGGRVVYFEHELARGSLLNRLAVALPCGWVVSNSTGVADANRSMWPHRDGTVVWPSVAAPASSSEGTLAELRQRHGIPGDRPVVAIVGRLVEWKGHARLIDAVARLRDAGTDLTLLVVGAEAHGVDPGLEGRLRAQAAHLGLDDRVVFTGQVASAAPYIQLSDVLACPSDGEPFGMVLLEAMALGVPVVAVDSHGPADIVVDGQTGALVSTGEPEELAGAMASLLSDPASRDRMGAAGRERFERMFTEERMLDELGRTFRGLAGEART